MAESSDTASSRPQLVEGLVEAAKRAFDPASHEGSRQSYLDTYNGIVAKTETWRLLPVLNSLVKPNVLPPWLRKPLFQTLTLVPMRSDGVRGTMEFIFSVHPSNQAGARDSEQPQKSGASITHEAVAVATRLLSTVPSTLGAEDWYGAIAPQLCQLLDGDAGPDLAKTAAQIIGFGILGKKATGAPGAAGWNAFVQPLLEQINPSLRMAETGTLFPRSEQDNGGFVDLSRGRIVVSSVQLHQALKRLQVLILSNPSPGLCMRTLKPVIIQLWALASISNPPAAVSEKYSLPAQALVQTYLKLFGKTESVCPIIRNILCEGSVSGSSDFWQYRIVDESNIDAIVPIRSPSDDAHMLAEIDTKADKLVQILAQACSNEELPAIFLFLLQRWVRVLEGQGSPGITTSRDEAMTSPVTDLAEVAVLQRLLELPPEKLVGRFDQLLDIICQILKGDGSTPLGDDVVSVALSLLNLVVTAPSFQRSDIKPDYLKQIGDLLDRISSSGSSEVSGTARNLAMLLQYRDEVEPGREKSASAPSLRQIEDKRTHNLAMSYITDSESPPPVVSEGLNMLSMLILTESPILDITAITALMSSLLKDSEDYVILRVVKIFTQLANRHPKSTIGELLDNYFDAQEKSTTDVRLRFGEALVQVIERLGQTFSGDVARQASEMLLTVAGRRGHRPKTMAKQAREEKLAALRRSRASSKDDEDEDEDEDEDVDVDLEDEKRMTEEEKANNDILARILQGWESKRGSEDVRMRTSALSVFGVALETNIGGTGPALVSDAVDLCINILAMERDAQHGILRRAAIMVVLSFVRALHQARECGRSLGFGLTESSKGDIQRTLGYVATTDNDGLVQQHARDVVESLQNWQAGSLLPQPTGTSASGLARLAGLTVNPEASLDQPWERRRPRIEEVE
ncbi:uncharacterized protein MAM_00840 [Metarhizium album ARSEF 1941]|uniref:Protein required for cell viability n=1 Tax=Metarhizium album (strain ARSEF 1941) TaxID=1081103 RepID=A0A0B2X641_METAS|nr:uncharacterized protein MAM_00840 [Metarhizium album ARSEF 1941]KHO01839.1 hypothetical protein MAM_00840 [Metarhizium album ARSEF 1941]